MDQLRPTSIKFGSDPGSKMWYDVEADEVDLRKNIVDDGGSSPQDATAAWEQWGGVQQRGAPRMLILTRLKPKQTVTRAPGPGPIREAEWKQFAQKHLPNRNVILHTDGARAYQLKVTGMLHDHVVHMKKKLKDKNGKPVKRNGKFVWILPKYAKVFKHIIPGTKKTVKCMGGSQVVDRFWQLLRSYLKCRSGAVGSASLRDRIRSAQWAHWYRADDDWSKTGEMLKHMCK